MRLNKEPIIEYMTSNITLMKWMIAEGYQDRAHALSAASRPWRPGSPIPHCSKPDADAEYAAVIEIDLADIKEPIAGLPE